MRGRRKQRFPGAGHSAERKFKQLRRQNIRDEWRVWGLLFVAIVGFAVWSFYSGPVAGRLFAAVAGALFGALFVMYSLGGHISAFHWWLGVEGERETAKQIEKLGPEWYCEHDLEHEYGNWDHVLVGPPGVFLLDSKLLHGTAEANGDALRSGRLRYPAGALRGGAKQVKVELEERLGFRASWVQAVFVIWAAFPQERFEEQDVVYIDGERLSAWLTQLPPKLTAPQRAAYATALQEMRLRLDIAQEGPRPSPHTAGSSEDNAVTL
jgi:hypothetical protein